MPGFRTQEEEELAHQNDRLASYIEKNRELEQQINLLKAQLSKCDELSTGIVTLEASLAKKSEEVKSLSAKLENAVRARAKGEQELENVMKMLRDLESRNLELDRRLGAKDAEIARLTQEKSKQLNDFNALKVSLHNEISRYRALLDRAGVEDNARLQSSTSTSREETPSTPIPAQRGGDLDDVDDDYSICCHYQDIAISDPPHGKYVQLKNYGDKEVSLSGWTLTRSVNGRSTTYTFHPTMKLGPNAEVTVWSYDAPNAVHSPPLSWVMKGKRWIPGEVIKTILKDGIHEVMAEVITKPIDVEGQRRAAGF